MDGRVFGRANGALIRALREGESLDIVGWGLGVGDAGLGS